MSEHPASAVLPRKRGWRRVAWMALTLGLGLAAGAAWAINTPWGRAGLGRW